MLDVEQFTQSLNDIGIDFFTGIPDSQLKPFCDYLNCKYKTSDNHIIGSNEGNCLAIAAGYHLATKKIPCVYMQNSGLGNTVNPITSLTNWKVYSIPTLYIIGWRGEPGVKDEPQHLFQGEITLKLLELLEIDYIVLKKDSVLHEINDQIYDIKIKLNQGKSFAFVVCKDTLSNDQEFTYHNQNMLSREEIIECIIEKYPNDLYVSTTGKASRELFEIREKRREHHGNDFLTVGSMGHSSMIAYGIALNIKNDRIWCLDGDGAVLMHMGALAIIGSYAPKNFVHVVLNNSAHDSVGGMPTVCNKIDLIKIAYGCGYKYAVSISNQNQLNEVLEEIDELEGPVLLDIKTSIGSRPNLGRPTTTTIQNKNAFMDILEGHK